MSRTKLDLSQISGTVQGQTLGDSIQKLNEVSYKVIVFVIPGLVKPGIQNLEIRFPFQGTVESVYGSVGTPGTTDLTLELQKCSQDFIDGIVSTPDWTNILSNNLIVLANKKSSNSSTPITFTASAVEINDHFRINVLTDGSGAKDLLVEVKIKLIN